MTTLPSLFHADMPPAGIVWGVHVFSFCGNAGNILEFIAETGGLPEDFGNVGEWFEKAEAFSAKRNEKFYRTRDALDFLNDDGLVGFPRVKVPCVGVEIEGGTINTKLTVPPTTPITTAMVVKAAHCENCGVDYLECPCVKMPIYVEHAELFEFFYTDRSAWSAKGND